MGIFGPPPPDNRFVVSQPEPRQVKRKSLTAAAARVPEVDSGRFQRLTQPWQQQALGFYDELGEVKFASGFYARMLSRLRLYVAELGDDGEWVETDNESVVDLLDRVQDPSGGREQMLGQYGRLMFITGEAYLLWTGETDTDPEKWEVVSTNELRIQGDGKLTRVPAPAWGVVELNQAGDQKTEPQPTEVIAYRLWMPHPSYSWLADSPMHGVLEICEELVLLTLAVAARAKSRLSGPGILLVPEEVSPKPPRPENPDDPVRDPLMEDLTEAVVTPIEDPGSAKAYVPPIVRGPGEHLHPDKFRMLRVGNPDEEYRESEERKQCVGRLGLSLDMEPEALTGLGSTNHWSGWVITDQQWTQHGRPVAQALIDDLTSAYLRPSIKAELPALDPLKFSVRYDAAEVTTNPDKSKSANEAYDRRAIGKAALRGAHDFTDSDAPTDEELEEMLLVALKTGVDVTGGAVTPAGGSDDTGDVEGRDTDELPPDEDDTQDDDGSDVTAAGIRLAGNVAVERCREVAGARLMTALAKQRSNGHLTACRQAAKGQVAHVLGRDNLPDGTTVAELVEGGAVALVTALGRAGYTLKVSEALAELVELHAARTLFDETPASLPAGFLSPLYRRPPR